MVDFVSLALTAKRLIDANGRTITVVKSGNVVADSAKPWEVSSTPAAASVSGAGVFVDPTLMGQMFSSEEGVKRGEAVCLFAANNDGDYALETFDTITDGTRSWRIIRAKNLQPADTKILYMFEVER